MGNFLTCGLWNEFPFRDELGTIDLGIDIVCKAFDDDYPFGTSYYIPLLLLYHTGMRVGEVLGLTWNDIDFAAVISD